MPDPFAEPARSTAQAHAAWAAWQAQLYRERQEEFNHVLRWLTMWGYSLRNRDGNKVDLERAKGLAPLYAEFPHNA